MPMTPKNCRVLAYHLHELRGRDAARSALRPLPVLHREDATPCLDALDRSAVVSNFFAKLEAGLFYYDAGAASVVYPKATGCYLSNYSSGVACFSA